MPDWTGPRTHPLPTRINGFHHAVPEPPLHPTVDDSAVRRLHERAAELLAAEFRTAPTTSLDDRRAIGEDIAAGLVSEHVDERVRSGEALEDAHEQALLDAVLAYLFGLGQLQAITDDPEVE